MTLDNIIALRGSGGMRATYKHVGPHKFTVQFLLKDGRKFIAGTMYRTKTQLMHDWLHNTHKFYKYNYREV